MSSGVLQRFSGKVKIGELFLGTAGIYDSASGISGKALFVQRLSLPVTAVASTAFTMSVPVGATILSAAVYTTTAYTAGTDCKISIGNVAAGAQYVAAVSIAAVGVAELTLVNAGAAALLAMPSGSPNVFITLAQTGTATSVGAAMLVILYSQA